MKKKRQGKTPQHFPSERLTKIPVSRNKHGKIVSETLDKLRQLDVHSAIKIDLLKTGKKKVELRAALHRAAKKERLALSTVSDERFLYVFREEPKPMQPVQHREGWNIEK